MITLGSTAVDEESGLCEEARQIMVR